MKMTPCQRTLLTDCLVDMFEAIKRLQCYLAKLPFAEFSKNLQLQDATDFNLKVIGQCAGTLQDRLPEFSTKVPLLPERFSYPMRFDPMPGEAHAHRVGELWKCSHEAVTQLLPQLEAARDAVLGGASVADANAAS